MRSFGKAGTMCLAWMLTFQVGVADPAAYFDRVDMATPPPSSFLLQVNTVIPECPAHRAGLRAGDLIAGLDGWRVRSKQDMGVALLQGPPDSPVTLAVVRNGRWETIRYTEPLRGRRGGFVFDEVPVTTVDKLLLWDVRIEPVFPDDAKSWDDLPDDVSQSLPAYGYGPRSWQEIQSGSGRVREAMNELAAARREGDREWVEGLVRAWMLLLRQEYAEAGRLLPTLLARPTHPFLDQYARFLLNVSREQGKWRDSDDWRRGGVDAAFFALCYPYPVVLRADRDAFVNRPALQAAFLRMAHPRSAADVEAIQELGGQFLQDQDDDVDSYLGQVAAAIVSWHWHGGWPFRSSLVYDRESCRSMLAKLKARFESHPEDRLLTAYALLSPAMRENDLAALRAALDVTHSAGTDHAAVANRILRNGAIFWRQGKGEWMGVWRDVEERYADRAAIFQYLAGLSPCLDRRLAMGASNLTGYFADLAMFANRNADLVYEGLVDPEDGALLPLLIDAIGNGTSLSKDAALDSFDRLVRLSARISDEESYAALFRSAPRLPCDHVLRGLTDVALGQEKYSRFEDIQRVLQPCAHWGRWLAEKDEASILAANEAAGKIAAGAPVQATCEAVLQTAGTPAGAVLLAAAAARGGDLDMARKLRMLALNFHLATFHGKSGDTVLWTLRNLLAAEGLETPIVFLTEDLSKSNDQRVRMLAALLAFRLGDKESAARLLASSRAVGFSVFNGPDTLIWNGRRLAPDQFRGALDDALAGKAPEEP